MGFDAFDPLIDGGFDGGAIISGSPTYADAGLTCNGFGTAEFGTEVTGQRVGGGGGRRHNRRRRILKKDIYGSVISAFEEYFKEAPTVAVAERVAAQVIKEVAVDFTYLQIQAQIVSIITRLEEDEDEEAALFSMV